MPNHVIDALQFQKLLTLDSFFNRDPFLLIKLDESDKTKLMLDSGYLHNITTSFWRILQVTDLLAGKEGDTDYCNFLMESFLSAFKSCTDSMAGALNHFLSLGKEDGAIAIEKESFIQAIEQKMQKNEKKSEACIWTYHLWAKNQIYPYRNILHHKGDMSSAVMIGSDLKLITCCVPVPDPFNFEVPDLFNFKVIAKEMNGYPNYTSYLIDKNPIRLPNILTGDKGDSDKYYSIGDFFREWQQKMHDLIICFSSTIVTFQS